MLIERLCNHNRGLHIVLYDIKCCTLVVCLQMLLRVVMVAAESLKLLEHQLMDGDQIQDVRVRTKHKLMFYCLHRCSTV